MLKYIFTFFLIISNSVYAKNTVLHDTLNNGLRVIIKEDHRAPVVLTQMWCHVGSADEYSGMTGISHMLEHMMFRGTEKYPGSTYSEIVKENGGQYNAFTSTDHTVYFTKIAKQNFPQILQLEADRLFNLSLSEKDFEIEKQVVLEERRLRVEDNPDALARERFTATAHLMGPYHHPVIGWMKDIENYNVNMAKQWYDTWYVPNNITLVIVGDINPEHTLGLVKNYFEKGTSKPLARNNLGSIEPGFGERRIRVNLKTNVPKLLLGYQVPVINSDKSEKDDWEVYALDVLSSALAGINSSRLDKILLKEKEVAAGVYSSYDQFRRYDTLLEVFAIPNQDTKLEDLEEEIYEQLEDLKTNLISDEELTRIKNNLIANKIYSVDSLFYSAYILATVDFLKQKDDYIEKIQSVTSEQVLQVAKKYLEDSRKTVTYLEPMENVALDENHVSQEFMIG